MPSVHSAPMTGANLVLPASDMTPVGLSELIVNEGVTLAGGVPTIWQGIVPLFGKYDFSRLDRILCGGSAVPAGLITEWRKVDVLVWQAWGMTETNPVATGAIIDPRLDGLDEDELRELMAALTLSPQVAGVTYPRGCRIRRVRVAGAKPEPRADQTVILSRRALEEARNETRAAVQRATGQRA